MGFLLRLLRKLVKRLRGELIIEDLVRRGLTLGKNVNIRGGVIIDPSHCWLIEIGDDVVIAPRAHILAHDASSIHHYATKIGRVKIGEKTFIGAGSIILPGVKIGKNVVIGAGSVVNRDIPDNSVAAGNPARITGCRLESEKKHRDNLLIKPAYPWPEWGVEGGITNARKAKMKKDLENSIGYLYHSEKEEGTI